MGAHVRRTLILNSVDFVREHYGPEAHSRILAELPPALRASFQLAASDAAWGPFEDLMAYMETAKRLLAPDAEDFYHRIGVFAGRRDRSTRAVAVMVEDRETAIRMIGTVWRTFVDEGQLELVERFADGALLRLSGVPVHPAICQRVAGSIEGLLEKTDPTLRVLETACRTHGAPACDLRVSWDAPGATR